MLHRPASGTVAPVEGHVTVPHVNATLDLAGQGAEEQAGGGRAGMVAGMNAGKGLRYLPFAL